MALFSGDSNAGGGLIPIDGDATKTLEVALPRGLGLGFRVGLVSGLVQLLDFQTRVFFVSLPHLYKLLSTSVEEVT